MNFWDQQTDLLEKTLRENMPALMLHYLCTAFPEDVEELAGMDALPVSENTRNSTAKLLEARLANSLWSPAALQA
jgi:hypothetical protein